MVYNPKNAAANNIKFSDNISYKFQYLKKNFKMDFLTLFSTFRCNYSKTISWICITIENSFEMFV